MHPDKAALLTALAKVEAVVPAARSLAAAVRLLRDPNSSLDAIGELISRDAALAVDVLRCANSAYYARREKVLVLADAIQFIGFKETLRLLALVAARQTANQNLGSYGISAEDFWAESLFNGLFAEKLAESSGLCDPGEAYTVGLLRYLGRLAINQAIIDLGGGVFWKPGTDLTEWERTSIGVTQAEAAVLLLRKWEFPEEVIAAVKVQEVFDPGPGAASLSLVSHFASRVLRPGLTASEIDTFSDEPPAMPVGHRFLRVCGWQAEDLREHVSGTLEIYRDIRDNVFG